MPSDEAISFVCNLVRGVSLAAGVATEMDIDLDIVQNESLTADIYAAVSVEVEL